MDENNEIAPLSMKLIPAIVDLEGLNYEILRNHNIDCLENDSVAISVKTENDAKIALSLALKARKTFQNLDKKRSEIIKPHFEYQKEINKSFQKFCSTLKTIEQLLISKLEKWIESENENPFSSVEKLQVEDGTLSTKTDFDFIISNENSVPLEYKSVDIEKVLEAIENGVRNIPGLEIFEKTTTTIRIKN